MAEKGSMNGQSIPAPQDYRTFYGQQNGQTTYPSLPAYSLGPMDQTHIPVNDEPTNQSRGCCGVPLPVSNADHAEMEEYYKIKPPLQLDFQGTFQAPEDTGAIQGLTNINRYVFNWTKRGLYFFLVCVAGTIMAFAFGLVFAIMDFALVWMMNPFARLVHIVTRFFKSIYEPFARVSLDPVFEAIGRVFWARNAGPFTERSYRVNVSGINYGDNPTSESRETV